MVFILVIGSYFVMSKVLIANLVSSINVSSSRNELFCRVALSKFVLRFIRLLYRLGYISGYRIINSKFLDVFLKYFRNSSVINHIKLLSKPGRRLFIKYSVLKKKFLSHSAGCFVINTHKGLISNVDALKYRIGGEFVAVIR